MGQIRRWRGHLSLHDKRGGLWTLVDHVSRALQKHENWHYLVVDSQHWNWPDQLVLARTGEERVWESPFRVEESMHARKELSMALRQPPSQMWVRGDSPTRAQSLHGIIHPPRWAVVRRLGIRRETTRKRQIKSHSPRVLLLRTFGRERFSDDRLLPHRSAGVISAR